MPKRRRRQEKWKKEQEVENETKIQILQIPIPSTSIISTNNDIYGVFESLSCSVDTDINTGSSNMTTFTHTENPWQCPPSHWLKYLPTYPNSNPNPNPNPVCDKKENDEEEGQAAAAGKRPTTGPTKTIITEDEITMLWNHLNDLKSNLMPYSEIVSDLKHEYIYRCRTSPKNEFRHASRHISVNPYEFVYFTFDGDNDGDDGGSNMCTELISRSALKLCNMDALAGFTLAPSSSSSSSSSSTFVDLCGAPGGFSQYLLHRGYQKGYGMSLNGTSDSGDSVGVEWNVDALKTKFEVHDGHDGTGDIYNWQNVVSLRNAMEASDLESELGCGGSNSENSNGKNSRAVLRAAVVVADGGLDAQRNAMDQEIVANKLVVCQTAAAIFLLETGGTFVLKMFGFRSKTCQKLMAFLANVFFEKIIVLKPVTSRPASAERYLFCTGFKGIEKEFDVLKWRDELLAIAGDSHGDDGDLLTAITAAKNMDVLDPELNKDLNQFLRKVDHDMLCLNIRACTKIITCLREEEEWLLGSSGKRNKKRKNRLKNEELNIAYMKEHWCI